MFFSSGVITQIGELVKQAVDRTQQRMVDGDVEDEPTLTGSFVENLRLIFEENPRLNDYNLRIRVLRGIGRNAPENRFGADICVIFTVNEEDYELSKGFLMQAKWADRSNINVSRYGFHRPSFSINTEFRRMQGQCDDMLRITPDSFVILYSINGFTTIPASSIRAVRKQEGRIQLYSKHVHGFFKEFIMSFIGDSRLSAPDDDTLERLQSDSIADYILSIALKEITHASEGVIKSS